MRKESSETESIFLGSFSSQYRRILAELFVIVAGILLALAIDEWREDIENKGVEREYILQLIIDLRSTEELIASVIELNASTDAAASRLLAIFESGKSIEPEEVRQLLGEVFDFDNPVPVLGTADALVATGDLRLIRDSKIRAEITRYLSHTRDYLLVPIYDLESEYRAHYARITIIAAANGVLPTSPNVEGQIHQVPNVGAFLADAEAYAEVLRFLSSREQFKYYRTSLASEAATTRELLEGYMHSN